MLYTRNTRQLTTNEYNALTKIAYKTGMDCWFQINTVCGLDYVYDLENERFMCLDEGVEQLVDGMVEPPENRFYRLTPEEIEAFRGLLNKLGIRKEFDNGKV